MPDIEFKLTAVDEASPVIDRVRRQLDRFNQGYAARTGGGAGGSGTSTKGGSGGGPLGGPLGKGILGGLASLTIVGMGIKAVLGKISQTLIQASPYLQAVTNDMKNALTLYIRPYGDKLAKLLQPMSEAMIEDAEKSTEWNEANPDAMPWMDPTLPGNKNRDKLMKNLKIDWDQIGKDLNFFDKDTQRGIEKFKRSIGKFFKGLGGNMGNMSMSATGGASYEGDLSTEGAPDSSWGWENIIAPLSGFGDWLMNNIDQGIGDLSTKLGGFGDWLYDGMTGWWDDEEDSKLGGFASWLLGKITEPLSNIGQTLSGFGTWVWGKLTGGTENAGASLSGFGTWLWEKVTSPLGNVGSSLAGFGTWLWSGITAPLGGIGASLSGFGSWLWSGITSPLSGVGSSLSGFGTWLWNKVTGGFGDIASKVGGFGTWVYNKLTGALSTLASTIGGIPAQLWNGMRAALQEINIEILGKKISPFDFIPKMASGGIVTSPTVAMIGEAGPEAVIPLSKMGQGGMGGQPIQINIYGNVYGVNDLERTIDEAIARSQLGYSGYR